MKTYKGKATIGWSVDIEDNASMEEIKTKIADAMGWQYFCWFKPEDIFDVQEIPFEPETEEEDE